ncbi:MAG: VacJ family lipoprotein [Methylococcaceae bacterium]|nr:VacJ family lipoprotein [Methylococcaceae bacterium]OYV23222.1 MAG: VacJ family lipoprotein [Methylococcaceae bacterium NSO1]
MSMQKTTIHKPLILRSLVISITLAGCASTETTVPAPNDPWAGWNRGTQTFNDNLDKAILKPVAKGYQWITPEFVNDGVTNFFSNINDIGVTINGLLQFKLAQSGMDASRFLINTTAGIGGFIDVAKMIDLPKHNEDFGQTLGFWGVPSGSYLVLPFFGPSSPRDTFGLVGDALLNPVTYVSIFGGAAVSAATAGSRALDVTDRRANLMTTEKIVDEGAVDRYDFIKNSYEQNRDYLIHDGNPPDENDPDLLDENSEESGNVSNLELTGPN